MRHDDTGYLLALASYLTETGSEDGTIEICEHDRKLCAAVLRMRAASLSRGRIARVAGISLMVALCAAGPVLARLA